MRKEDLPAELRRRVEAAERRLGRRLVLRGACWPDPTLRGRVSRRAGAVVLEYRDDVVGFFWHYDIIGELLDHVEKDRLEITLRDREHPSIEDRPQLGPQD